MKKTLIFRGCPGSGKTTRLKKDYPTAFICSADDFFLDTEGNYKYHPQNIINAHVFCRNAFWAAIRNGLPLIAVDNTNRWILDFEWYITVARKCDYRVEVIRMKVDDINDVAKRNVHGVPLSKVVQVHESMENYPGEIFV